MFAREEDNVVFVTEPCDLFDPSCVKVCLARIGVYTFWGYYINPLGTLLENSVK